VTARTSSSRLPNKVLHLLHGRPMLAYTVERLQAVAPIDEIVVATSTDRSDDSVADCAAGWGVFCWRGSLDDVLDRIREAAAAREAEAVIRISGDSPLIDPALVLRAIELFRVGGAELVTNVFPRSFPKGQSVEVLSRRALERLAAEAMVPADREHVTTYAYAHPERFAIRNFASTRPRPSLQLSVDTESDLARVDTLITAWKRPGFPTAVQLIELVDAMSGAA
jgi:spore coat polysaccharide biosynthesis protein SpsF (cytidylyltransferase family)